jgi:hypothetical protein
MWLEFVLTLFTPRSTRLSLGLMRICWRLLKYQEHNYLKEMFPTEEMEEFQRC